MLCRISLSRPPRSLAPSRPSQSRALASHRDWPHPSPGATTPAPPPASVSSHLSKHPNRGDKTRRSPSIIIFSSTVVFRLLSRKEHLCLRQCQCGCGWTWEATYLGTVHRYMLKSVWLGSTAERAGVTGTKRHADRDLFPSLPLP